MAIKIGRNSPPSINVLHKAQKNPADKLQRVVSPQTLHNDTNSVKAVPETEESLSRAGQAEFETAIAARGIGGKLSEQLLTIYEILLTSDDQAPAQLALLLYQNVAADAVIVDQQFVESFSMLSEAVTEEILPSVDVGSVVERFAEILEGGQVTRKQHAELEGLIGSTSPAIDASDAVVSGINLPTLHKQVELREGLAHAEDPIGVKGEPAQEPSGQAPVIAEETILHPLTPATEGVDPQQWHTQYSQPEDVLGLSGSEFLLAVYGSGAGAASDSKNAELLEFGRYAGSIFLAYANDDNLLFDDEVMLMQDDGVLIETDDGWLLDIDLVTERVDTPIFPVPDWILLPLSTLEGTFAIDHLLETIEAS